MYILITAAASAQAYQLKSRLDKANILMGDYMDLPGLMLNSGKLIQLPDPKLDTYPHQMLALCLDKQIDTVYLLREEELAVLTTASQLFNEYGINLIDVNDTL